MEQYAKGELDISGIKRCYLDLTILSHCPVCLSPIFYTFKDQYLSYPKTGKDNISTICRSCEAYVTMPIEILGSHIEMLYDTDIQKVE